MSLSFWCKVYHALVLLCCKFERDRWSRDQRGASRQKLLEAMDGIDLIYQEYSAFSNTKELTHCSLGAVDEVINVQFSIIFFLMHGSIDRRQEVGGMYARLKLTGALPDST